MMGGVLVAIYSVRDKRGARELFIASLWMVFWAMSSLVEMICASFPIKLLWRNITQIGVFFTPVASLMFALVYTGYFTKQKRKIATVAYSYQSIAVLLIFTDELHHWMRTSVSMVQGTYYQIIGVETTALGKIFISGNFLFMLLSFAVISFALFRVNRVNLKQMLSVLLGIAIPLLYALLKVGSDGKFLEIVPISGVFFLSGLFMLLGIHRFDLLRITPLARERAFTFLGEGIVICTSDAQVLDANPAAKTLLGESLFEIGENLKNLVPYWYDTVLQGTEQTFELQLNDRWLSAKLYPIFHEKQQVLGSITLIEDVSSEKQHAQLLKTRAEVDSMTSLLNRPTFIEQAEHLIAQANTSVQLIYFDIDHFKAINDRYGHRVGDAILSDFGTLVVSTLPKGWIAGRMGGEEFAILCIDQRQDELLGFAESCKDTIAQHRFTYEDVKVRATISVGVSSAVKASFDELYKEADRLLYVAKRDGRNCVRFQRLN